MAAPPIRFDRSICGSLEEALKREWLETNGLGGFASSTIAGLNTRRYHGLLMAATRAPAGRTLLLSKVEETLLIDGRRFELSANHYPGVVHPQGYRYLKEFRLDPFPIFVYQIEDVEFEKRVFMVHGENTTVVEYELRGISVPGCALEVRPLIAFRDYHATTHANDVLDPTFTTGPGRVTVAPYPGLPKLHVNHDAAEIEAAGVWYFNFEYDVERERGLDYREDLFNPFVLRFDLCGRPSATMIASTEPRDVTHASVLRFSEIARRYGVQKMSRSDDPLVEALASASDQFIVQRGNLKTIIAGYHWFCDWGRDAMVSLPGLTLATGRTEIAKSILLEFSRYADRGMLPNQFPEGGDAQYNTVDAALWLFEAVRAFLSYTGDTSFVKNHLYETLTSIVDWYVRGTRFGIHVDSDGLVTAGEPGVQLTWMDAKVGDWVVTPRHGKPVEIQALWYNALRSIEQMARGFGDTVNAARYAELADLGCRNFFPLFWNEPGGFLCDVVNGEFRDTSIRPNQIFAVSLAHSMLPVEISRRVVGVVERELLTPYGLRSLACGDPNYHPQYTGDQWARDAAYHQGTVWSWLLGPFITAYVKVNGPTARGQAMRWLDAFREHLSVAGLGQISEIFDGDPPHAPRGCIAQAWSVAELLRTAVEDIFN